MNHRSIKKYFLSGLTQQELVLALVDKVIMNLQRAKLALAQKDYETVNQSLIDSENILLELEAMMRGTTEETEKSAAILKLLAEHIFLANINRDEKALTELTHLVGRLRTLYAIRIGRGLQPPPSFPQLKN